MLKKIMQTIFCVKNEMEVDDNNIPLRKVKNITLLGINIKLNFPLNDYYKRSIKQWYIKDEYKEANQIYPKTPSYKKLRLRFGLTKKPTLLFCHHMVLSICTLKCKECCCYIPYYSKEAHLKPLNFSKFKKELDALLATVTSIEIYSFMGGEPLLVKDLPMMVDYAAKQKKIKFLYITTNGTLIPSNNLLKTLKKHNEKIKVSISNYTFNENLKQNDIKYEFFEENHWYSNIELLDKTQGVSLAYGNFSGCYMKNCITYMDSKLYLCPMTAYADRNNKPINNDGFLLFGENAKKNKENLIEFLEKNFFDVCGYCNHKNVKEISVAEQIETTENALLEEKNEF